MLLTIGANVGGKPRTFMSDVVQTCMSGICIDFGQRNNLQTLLNKQGQFYSQRKRFMHVSNKQALPLELPLFCRQNCANLKYGFSKNPV